MEQQEQAKNPGLYQEISCVNCGSVLNFEPGTAHLNCNHCGTYNEIEASGVAIEELDFTTFVREFNETKEQDVVKLVQCKNCAAQMTFEDNVVGQDCAFCGSSLVIEGASDCAIVKPQGVLPFKITRDRSFNMFRTWLKGLWFAPSKLQRFADVNNELIGIYIPYWTYDCHTESSYSGLRGDNYVVHQNVTVIENGRSVTRSMPVVKTRWFPTSGHVSIFFDDVLVAASTSLPRKELEAIAPFDLRQLVPFKEAYLTGFRTESYQVDLEQGFSEAKSKIDARIRTAVHRDIGGDLQRIHSLNTDHQDITFKHILLPIWISSYEYRGKIYRFIVNGRTGKVKGERPYSPFKIALAVIVAILIIAAIVFFSQATESGNYSAPDWELRYLD